MPSLPIFQVELQGLGRPAKFELSPHPWQNNKIRFDFFCTSLNLKGYLVFEADTGNYKIHLTSPLSSDLLNAEQLQTLWQTLAKSFLSYYQWGWSPPDETTETYSDQYLSEHGYDKGTEHEQFLKQVNAQIIQRISHPQKLLVAGCAAGELVRQCRKINIETWGFDLPLNLQEIAFPEIAPYVRSGSLSEIPFDVSDDFDVLVAIDVLEHVPESHLLTMVQEWIRLDLRSLVLLINLNDCSFPGHITLRPIEWWAEKFKPHFLLEKTISHFEDLPAVYGNIPDYNRQWTVWKRSKP